MSDSEQLAANMMRFTGFSALYNRARPQTPPIVAEVLLQVAGMARAGCVVDLGCGTGLSTRVWAERADQVIGIEPSDDMRQQAERYSATLPNVRYLPGHSAQTGLPAACADIVTAAQAFHWMEPATTLAEVARLLRPGGLFAAIDYDIVPIIHWEAQALLKDFLSGLRRFNVSPERGREWPKETHLERMAESGHFRYTREFVLHHVEQGSAERLCELALSYGFAQTLLKHGYNEAQIGIPELRASAERILGAGTQDWYITNRIRIGICQDTTYQTN